MMFIGLRLDCLWAIIEETWGGEGKGKGGRGENELGDGPSGAVCQQMQELLILGEAVGLKHRKF
jgi:hypothetical protein